MRITTSRQQAEMRMPWQRRQAMPYRDYFDEGLSPHGRAPKPPKGTWYHGSDAELEPGTELDPTRPNNYDYAPDTGQGPRDSKVFMSDSPDYAGAYGKYLYEIEPTGGEGPFPWNGEQDGAYAAPGGRILRRIPQPWERQGSLNEALWRYAARTDAYDLVDHQNRWGDTVKEPPGVGEVDQTPVRPGPWYHSSDSVIEPGTVLDPHDPYHPNHYDYSRQELGPRDHQVFMHHSPAHTETYGKHLYEVEPLDEGPYAYNGEDKANNHGDGYASPRARIIREIKREDPNAEKTRSFADAMAMMASLERSAAPKGLRFVHYPGNYRNTPRVDAHVDGVDWPVGSLMYQPDGQEVEWIDVHADHRLQGIGEAMYNWTKKHHAPDLHHSTDLTDDGKAFSQHVGAVPQTLHRGLTLDLDSPEGSFGAASPQLRKILTEGGGPESPEFIEELLRHGTGTFWTTDEGFAKSVNPTGGNGLKVVLKADWDGNDYRPPEGFDRMMDMPGFDISMVPAVGAMGEVRLKPRKKLKVRSIQLQRKGDPNLRELLRQPIEVQAQRIAMPMRDAWDDEHKDQDNLRYFSPEFRDIQQDPTPEHGWIHTSPRPHAIGDVLTPRGDVGTSEYQEYYNQTNHGSRRNWVWVSPKPEYDNLYRWTTDDDYVYEVEPIEDGPHPWNGSGGDGYVAKQVRIKDVLRQPKIPNATPDGPPKPSTIVLPPWERAASIHLAEPYDEAFDPGVYEEHPERQAEPAPEKGPWWHASEQDYRDGDLITPNKGYFPSRFNSFYEQEGFGDRQNWVWMDHPEGVRNLWGTGHENVYEVEPLDEGPWPYNGGDAQGSVAPRARVVRRVIPKTSPPRRWQQPKNMVQRLIGPQPPDPNVEHEEMQRAAAFREAMAASDAYDPHYVPGYDDPDVLRGDPTKPWLHSSPRPHAIGDVLTPNHGEHPSDYGDMYTEYGYPNRQDWVWMAQGDDANTWASDDDYVYEVEPLDEGPHPWNGDGYEGFVSPRVRVKGITREPVDPSATPWGRTLPPTKQQRPVQVAMRLGMMTIAQLREAAMYFHHTEGLVKGLPWER